MKAQKNRNYQVLWSEKRKSGEMISAPAEVGRSQRAGGFYSWHVNYITINRRKAIVCMNNLTRYPIVLYRPKAKDITHLGERVKEGIRAAFREEGILESVIEEYLRNCGSAVYSKTAGRSLVANLNKTCETVGYYSELMDEESVVQRRISLALGRYIVKFREGYDYPSERLFQALCLMKDMPEENWEQMLQIENYQLKIKLMLDGHDIWRRILIPSSCTFRQLHGVIQETFGWFDYHLHEFTVPDETYVPEEYTPLYAWPIKIRIVDGDDPEAEDYLEPDKYEVRYDNRTSLREIFEEIERCLYTYDFGDDWEHVILLEKVIKDSHNRFPVLMESEGERPPEDVGGPGGFEEYLSVISDPGSPEYESMVEWSEITKAKKKTIEEINRRLRYYS